MNIKRKNLIEVEDKEVVVYPRRRKGKPPIFNNGGNVEKLDDGIFKFNGDTHEEGGILTDDSGNFVFSEELIESNSGMSYAQLAEAIGGNNSISDEEKEQAINQLASEQEEQKGVNMNTRIMKCGGKISKMMKYGGFPKYEEGGGIFKGLRLPTKQPVITATTRQEEVDPTLLRTLNFIPVGDFSTDTRTINNIPVGDFDTESRYAKYSVNPQRNLRTEETFDFEPIESDRSMPRLATTTPRVVAPEDMVLEDDIDLLDSTPKGDKRNFMRSAAEGISKTSDALIPFADNIANYFINRERAKERIPEQKSTKPIVARSVDYSAALEEARRNETATRTALQRLGKANASALSLLRASRLGRAGAIKQAEANANAQMGSRTDAINSQIESQNAAIELANEMRKLGARDDIRRETSRNIDEFTKEFINQKNYKDQKAYLEKYAKDEQDLADRQFMLDLLVKADPRTLTYLENEQARNRAKNVRSLFR